MFSFSRRCATPFGAAIIAAISLTGWLAGSARGSRVVVGGIYLETDLLNPANSSQFQSYPNVGVYLHAGANISGTEYGWAALDLAQQQQLISQWGPNGAQSIELGFSTVPSAWPNDYISNFLPAGVVASDINVNVPTTDANNFSSPTDAFATLPASNISDWQNYVDAFRNLSNGAVNGIYPVYAPNLNVKDAEGVTIQAWTMGGPGPNPFASGSFFADVREMALYGGGITVDAPPKQFFNNIPLGANGQGRLEYQAITEGEVAWANSVGIRSEWIISPNTSGVNYNSQTQQLIRTLETNATGSLADIPTEYVVENYGTTTSIETNNPIGSETMPNTELGVALWLAGYEQGVKGDLQLSTAAANGSTHLKVSSQTGTSLGGTNTTVLLATAGLPSSSYVVTLENTSSNSSDWYIPNLLVSQTGAKGAWSVQVLLNGDDITSYLLGDSGFTFNATSIIQNAGLVMNNGDDATLTFSFTPLSQAAEADPYSFELTGLAHPGASDAFASIDFIASVPEPATIWLMGMAVLAAAAFTLRRRARAAR